MKLLTIDDGKEGRLGALVDEEVLHVANAAQDFGIDGEFPQSIKSMLADGGDSQALITEFVATIQNADRPSVARLREIGALTPYNATKLLSPIPNPAFVLSVGMNYRDHLAEMKTEVPTVPASFTKHPGSVIGPGDPIILPESNADMVDYEGEICFVFGRECYRANEEDAWDFVAGLTIANDVSARDWVAPIFRQETTMGAIHAWEVNVLGKQFPTFCPIGPVIATLDEIRDPGDLHIETRLNGEVMQSSNSNQLVFDIPKLIAYFSQWYRFSPGDIVTTGSPAGVGFGRNPKVFMRDGDVVEVELEDVGTLTNPVTL